MHCSSLRHAGIIMTNTIPNTADEAAGGGCQLTIYGRPSSNAQTPTRQEAAAGNVSGHGVTVQGQPAVQSRCASFGS